MTGGLDPLWEDTCIVRACSRQLYTYGKNDLPYIYLAEHSSDRTHKISGYMSFVVMSISIPENISLSSSLADFEIHYRIVSEGSRQKRELEFGDLQTVVERYKKELSSDDETGLIYGPIDNLCISLIRYSQVVALNSTHQNAREIIEHYKRGNGIPIGPDEKISDADFQRLLE